MPKVSVIIPCYNQGAYLDETVNSVMEQTFQDYEIIIINDGSTDDYTNLLLTDYSRPQTRVIHTANQGLATARNMGIKAARGSFILPLDADDRIGEEYLEKAVAVLDNHPEIGIVYCRAETFGVRTGPWHAPEFSLQRMLLGNLIFCSALFRREDWQRTKGYDPEMQVGWEDWDFWLSLLELGRKAYRIPEVLFFYRIKAISMARSMDARTKAEMHHRVMRNHPALFIDNARPLLTLYYRITGSLPYRILKRFRIPYCIGKIMEWRKQNLRARKP